MHRDDTTLQEVLVLGGGIAGLTAALELADAGHPVNLVEREEWLGGKAVLYGCKGTDTCQKCNVCLVPAKVREVARHPLIRVFTGSTVTSFTGEPGDFAVEVTRLPMLQGITSRAILNVSAAIIATGMEPYQGETLGALGLGRSGRVVTAFEFEKLIREDEDIFGGISGNGGIPGNGGPRGNDGQPGNGEPRVENGEPRVAFIQCVGSRDRQIGRDYCSRVCCMYALRMARWLRWRFPETRVSIFYMDLQIGGKDPEGFYKVAASDPMVGMVRWRPAEVRVGPGQMPRIRYFDSDTGRVEESEYDYVVLSVGIGPAKGTDVTGEAFGLNLDRNGFLAGLPGDPTGNCTPVKGVYLAGCAAGPRDIEESMAHATSAACEVREFLGSIAWRDGRPSIVPIVSAFTGNAPAGGAYAGNFPAGSAGNFLAGDASANGAFRRHVLIIGRGQAADEVAQHLGSLGIPSMTLPGPPESELICLEGHVGDFTVTFQGAKPESDGGGIPGTEPFPQAIPQASPCGSSEDEMVIHTGAIVVALDGEPRTEEASFPGAVASLRARVVGPIAGPEEIPAGAHHVVFLTPPAGRDTPSGTRRLLEAALSIAREAESQVYVICENLRVSAPGLEELYRDSRDAGVVFIRRKDGPIEGVEDGKADSEESGKGGTCHLLIREADLGDGESVYDVKVPCDVLVLPEVPGPHPDSLKLAKALELRPGPGGFLQEDNVHFFPSRSERRGVYYVGNSRKPSDPDDVRVEAMAIAEEVARLLSGKVPVAGQEVPTVAREKCALCLTCYRLCPHRAILAFGRRESAEIDRFACQECGACVAGCPARAIKVNGSGNSETPEVRAAAEMEAPEAKAAVEMGRGPAGVPEPSGASKAPPGAFGKCVVFSCENSAMLALEAAKIAAGRPGGVEVPERIDVPEGVDVPEAPEVPSGAQVPRWSRELGALLAALGVKVKSVPCSGRVEATDILGALEEGARGVLLLACLEGNCKHLDGNIYAARRLAYLQNLISEAGFEPERLRVEHVSASSPARTVRLIEEMVRDLDALDTGRTG